MLFAVPRFIRYGRRRSPFFIAFCLAAYFFPTLVAVSQHGNATSVASTNFFFGGRSWVGSLP